MRLTSAWQIEQVVIVAVGTVEIRDNIVSVFMLILARAAGRSQAASGRGCSMISLNVRRFTMRSEHRGDADSV
jgi:hypothetical protein